MASRTGPPAPLRRLRQPARRYLPDVDPLRTIRPQTHGQNEPRFITIHSTQDFSQGANALAHANLLKRGGLTSEHNSLGYLTWHFIVDQDCVYQHLPVDEQGQHADYNGNGNKLSIGIEMCENAGSSREETVNRTVRLVAWLMKTHHIPE